MRRVVPSQVREYIQAVFGAKSDANWNVATDDSAQLAGLLTICEGLPDELLTGPDYANYIAALATIQHQLEERLSLIRSPMRLCSVRNAG